MDDFYLRLRKLAESCEFNDVEREIRSQIILKCTSKSLRRRALREDLALQDILKFARAQEVSEEQAQTVEQNARSSNRTSNTNAVRHRGSQDHTNRGHGGARRKLTSGSAHGDNTRPPRSDSHAAKQKQSSGQKSKTCFRCGGAYPHSGECKAVGKKCRNCGKLNHFQSVCLKKQNQIQTNAVSDQSHAATAADEQSETDSDSEPDYVYSTKSVNAIKKLPACQITVQNSSQNVQAVTLIDTGSSENIMDTATYQKLDPPPQLRNPRPDEELYPYAGKHPLPVLGIAYIQVY